MRCALLGLLIAGAVAGRGLAADLPAAEPAKVVLPAPAFTWSGTYVGLNFGDAAGSFNFDPSTTNNLTGAVVDSGSTSVSDSAIIGGFQISHNWQFGSWVIGLEHNTQFGNLQQTLNVASPAGALLPGDSLSAKVDVLGATGAKVGWAWDRVLLYATGGLETGLVNASANYIARPGGSPAQTFSDNDKIQTGYTVGAGLDYAITDRLNVGVEYRYVDLGSQTFNLGAVTGSASAGASTVNTNVVLHASEVTARLNFKLGDTYHFRWLNW